MPTLTLEEALERIAALPRPRLEEEPLSIHEGGLSGRVLARPVAALCHQPPFDRSPLDGFALRSADSAGAGEALPCRLPVSRAILAGDPAGEPLVPGQAVRIMTGAPLPQGADCVIRQEEVRVDGATLTLTRPLNPDENRVFRGEDFQEGEELLPPGLRLDAAAVGLAASAGYRDLICRRRLRAAVLSTGSELAEQGAPLAPGKLYDGNCFYLRTRLEELGVRCSHGGAVPDDARRIAGWLEAAVDGGCDLVVATGGVSVGLRDLLPQALALLGAQTLFHGLALKPGSPALLACWRERPLLCLSGNPFAAAATFELLGLPLLARLGGDESLLPQRVRGVLDTPFAKASRGRRFIRGRWEAGRIRLPQAHSSGQLRSLIGCNCLVDIPAGSGPLEVGQRVDALLTWEGGR